MSFIFRRCPHDRVRCVHGDEIIRADWRRVACLDCGKYLKGELPIVCYFTGQVHQSIFGEVSA